MQVLNRKLLIFCRNPPPAQRPGTHRSTDRPLRIFRQTLRTWGPPQHPERAKQAVTIRISRPGSPACGRLHAGDLVAVPQLAPGAGPFPGHKEGHPAAPRQPEAFCHGPDPCALPDVHLDPGLRVVAFQPHLPVKPGEEFHANADPGAGPEHLRPYPKKRFSKRLALICQ